MAITLWRKATSALDQYGKADTFLSLLGRVGLVLAAFGFSWAGAWKVLQNLPLFSQLTVAVGFGFLVAAAVGHIVIRFRAWRERRGFNLVVLPWVRPDRVELFIVNQGESDDFKVQLHGPIFLHLDDYPRALPWRDSAGEHRTIFGTSGEVLRVFGYSVDGATGDAPPTIRLAIASPISPTLDRVFDESIYRRSADDQFDGEKGDFSMPLRVSVIGRQTPAKYFTVQLTFTWYSQGVIAFEIKANVTPAQSFGRSFGLHRILREELLGLLEAGTEAKS